ncbi:MAG: CBS domain-containing protein [Betaproteobacteria bacterium]|jgi:magnesium transporter|nr:CBS domain-containing protein [Betaproteobacteria bacterium]
MADAEDLTHTFVDAHPVDAARVLEALPATEAAALFGRLPPRLGGPVLAAMLPPTAARVLGALDNDQAMALLASIGVQPAVAVLRHVQDPRRARLLDGLPTTVAVASRMLLGYPEDTVGAWTDPDIVALPPDTAIGDAISRIRVATTDISRVHVIGPGERLLGTVELATLLRAQETAQLGAVLGEPQAVLAAVASLAGAATHRGWELAASLPVVERGDRLVGVLRRATLMRALSRGARSTRTSHSDTLTGLMARNYWDALSGLVTVTIALLPSTRPLGRSSDDG